MHKKAIALLIAGIVIVSGTWAYFYLTADKSRMPYQPSSPSPSIHGATAFSFEFNDPNYTPRASQYELPLELNAVNNFAAVDDFFELNQTQKDFLEQNGFVGIRNYKRNYSSFVKAYERLSYSIPIFVTTDSLIHTYHIYFDNALKSIEKEYLINSSREMTNLMLNITKEQYENTNDAMKELARKNVAYFAVASRLITPNSDIPDYVLDDVTNELDLIDFHQDIWSYIFDDHKEDYTQYKPRGHYTESEELQRYFKLMMWYGRMGFRIINDDETQRAILIADGLEKNNDIIEHWSKIYEVTKFFVGIPDDLTYQDYMNATRQVYGNLSVDYHELNDHVKLSQLKEKLREMRKPKICSSIIIFGEEFTNVTHGFRFIGQRFIPDSYMFQELVYDRVSTLQNPRFFPKGLDVMAVLGNEEARRLEEPEKQYLHYEEQLNNLTSEFSQYNQTAWTQNLYWGWLYTLKSLNKNFSKEEYPTFMKNQAWQDKELNTNLASWTELRHDTILYAKQSYPPCGMSPEDKGYVEPIPEFYSRLGDLTNATIQGLTNLSLITESIKEDLYRFENLLIQLEEISLKEIENIELTDEEYLLIKNIGDHISTTGSMYSSDDTNTTLIADVHTDPNSGRCLEEAVGYVDFIVVVIKKPNGNLTSMAGPIFSYYEFKQPMSNRLTDEEWRNLLQSGNAPNQPDWIELFAP
jgi:hypothetical protein